MVHSISILGSTGSIGRQTVAVAEHLGLNVRALTTNRNIQLAEEQARRLHPAFVAVTDEASAKALRIALADTDIAVGGGENALCEAAVISDTDAVVTAVSGAVGLRPTLAAIEKGRRIALANKETLVCAGDTLLLIDAGISCRRIEQSLRALGRTLGDLTAVFITHEHADHVGGLATLSKKSAAPVYVTRGVSHILTCPVVAFTAGDTLEFAGCTVRSFSTSHDAVDPVGYRVDAPDGSLGILTDTGFVTGAARESLAGVDTLLLEANHDVETLQYGPYPYFLKRRILGDEGHLSNDAAAEFARLAVQSGTRDILLAHLSKENNTPELAEYAVARALQSAGLSVRLGVAPRDTMSEVHLCRRSPSFASAN